MICKFFKSFFKEKPVVKKVVPIVRAPLSDVKSLNEFYGDPKFEQTKGGDIRVSREWANENLVYIVPPYKMKWSWGGECQRIRVHKKVAESLLEILTIIGNHYTPAELTAFQLDECGGGFTPRPVRGTMSKMSIHSWGAAIDLAPRLNGLGKKWNPSKGMMPEFVINLFEARGWVSGAKWTRADAMHFQFARIAKG